MKKLLLCCKQTMNNEGVLFAEFGREYIGFLTDNDTTLTVEGENRQTVVFTGLPGEDDRPRPYYTNLQYYNHFCKMRQMEPIVTIDIVIWRPIAGKLHYSEMAGSRTIAEVYQDIKQALVEQDLWSDLDYFDLAYDAKARGTEPFPDFQWISVFPVKGDSEGYYFHIEVIDGEKRQLIYLGKTLSEDIEVTLKINNALIRLFH